MYLSIRFLDLGTPANVPWIIDVVKLTIIIIEHDHTGGPYFRDA